MPASPLILLINPYIWDFTAFDLWAKPLGLLYLAGILRQSGYQVRLLDCLDVHFGEAEALASRLPRKTYGTGQYLRQRLSKPPGLENIPRHFYRYGIAPQIFLDALKQIPPPEAVLITSTMTYWYKGIAETIALYE